MRHPEMAAWVLVCTGVLLAGIVAGIAFGVWAAVWTLAATALLLTYAVTA